MRLPLKLCVEWLPIDFCKKVPFFVQANPRKLLNELPAEGRYFDFRYRVAFSMAVTALGSGTTWKTTKSNRHPRTDELIRRACKGRSNVLLDIGVSDGITSLELIEKLNGAYERYYVTDVSFHTHVIQHKGKVYFFDAERRCTLAASKRYLVYASLEGALFPFNMLARHVLSAAPAYNDETASRLPLANPGIRALAEKDPRIIIQDYSIFDPWQGRSPDIIKVANVLNRDYFSEQMLRKALMNLRECLKPGGMLFVTDNRRLEQISVFAKTGNRLEVCERVNGGCSVASMAVNL
jgi:SAM-dependent methyltransferase